MVACFVKVIMLTFFLYAYSPISVLLVEGRHHEAS